MIRKTLLALFVLLATVSITNAAPITTLNNTGAAFAPGAQDLKWMVGNGPAWVTSGWPANGTWMLNDARSKWISPNPSYSSATDLGLTTYQFWTTFTIPAGYDPAQSRFEFRLAVDNQVTNVFLNSNPLGIVYRLPAGNNNTVDSFKNFSPYYAVNSGFVSGLNTLTFDVLNGPNPTSGSNPAGLRVEFERSDMAPVPEPASLLLLGTGLVGAARAVRKRRG